MAARVGCWIKKAPGEDGYVQTGIGLQPNKKAKWKFYMYQKERMYRNPSLLRRIGSSPCQHCGADDGTIVAAHSNQLRDGKGRGLKAHDYRIAALCYTCHAELDQGSKMSKQERVNMWEEAHRKTIGWLFDNDIIKVVSSSS